MHLLLYHHTEMYLYSWSRSDRRLGWRALFRCCAVASTRSLLVVWILVAAFPREIIVLHAGVLCSGGHCRARLATPHDLTRAKDDVSHRVASHVRRHASPSPRAYSRRPACSRKREQTDASMFALTFSPPGARALGVAERRVARRVRRGACASTTWSLDGVGCAGARSGDEHLVGYRRMQSNRDPRRCPLKPIDVSGLCDAHQGKFKMLDAVFEQENGQLFVYSAKDAPDRPAPEDRCASTARARATTIRLTRTTRRVSIVRDDENVFQAFLSRVTDPGSDPIPPRATPSS